MKEILKIKPEEYFERDEVSSSMLKDFRSKGPWTYYHTHVAKTVESDGPSNAMKLGSAFHWMMANGSVEGGITTYGDTYPPDGSPLNLRKKDHREYLALLRVEAESVGLILISEEELAEVEGMCASVWENAVAHELIAEHDSELFERPCSNEVQGVPVRAMADVDRSEDGIIIDFKTTRRHTTKDFVKDAFYRFGYHFQGAHYLDVFEAKRFVIIGVRNFRPFESIVYDVPKEMIRDARHINHDTLQRIRWCTHANFWHSDGWGEHCNLEEVLNNG